MLNFRIVLALLSLVFLISCSKHKPQLPSNKGRMADKSIALLLEMNQKLTLKEDSIILKYVETSDQKFKKNELGFWYLISKTTQKAKLKDKEAFRFDCKMSLLNGKLLKSEIKEVSLGKKELVQGLEEALKLMHKGESATFVIPWYLGYGMKGNGKLIPPYTSLIYEVNLFE